MTTFKVTYDYPYTKWYRNSMQIEAESEGDALRIWKDIEARGELDYSSNYTPGEGDAGDTELISVEEVKS
jgi:hypothetical protein